VLGDKQFTYTQAMTIQLFCMNVQLKFEKSRVYMATKGKKSEVEEIIELIGRITKTRTLKGLMRSYTYEIPKFFGFKQVAIMFHDEE
jgi:hypothetical protein